MTQQRDIVGATGRLAESLDLVQKLAMTAWIPALLEGFGQAAAMAAEPQRAVRLAGAAAALRRSVPAPLSPVAQAQLDSWLTPMRALCVYPR